PSVASYARLNIETGTWEQPDYGIYFTPSPTSQLFYAEGIHHVSGASRIKTAGNQEVYVPDDGRRIVEGLFFNTWGDRMAFFEEDDNGDNKKLVIAAVNSDYTLSVEKHIPYESATGFTNIDMIELLKSIE